MKKLLRDTAGFTLAEQLLSALFIGLLAIAIAAGLGVAAKVYGSVSYEAGTNQLMARAIQEINDELAYAVSVNSDGRNYVSPTTRTTVRLENSNTETKGIVMTGVGLGGSLTSGEKSVILVPESSALHVHFDAVPSYSKTTNLWTYTISVQSSTGNTVATQTMKVVRNGEVS